MRQDLKICLPLYKVGYSMAFLLILSLVRTVAYTDEIGIALDANVALLALVFCAETYVMEREGKRWEIFALFPLGNRCRVVLRRIIVQIMYLCLISYVGYFFFYWQKPFHKGNNSLLFLVGIYWIAVTATIMFWSILSVTVSTLCRNQWAGIGISGMLWFIIKSKLGSRVLGKFNIFAFWDVDAPQNFDWLWGKGLFLLLAAVMLVFLPTIIKKRG